MFYWGQLPLIVYEALTVVTMLHCYLDTGISKDLAKLVDQYLGLPQIASSVCCLCGERCAGCRIYTNVR